MPRLQRIITLEHRHGLHARPSMAIVETVNNFSSTVLMRHQGHEVNAASILELLHLQVTNGATLEFEADGDDAEQVLNALQNLFARRFNLEL